MDKSFVKKLTEITEANLSDPQFGVVELAREMGTSYSNLRRKVHTLTGKSVTQFIREIRLDKAMELLQQEELTAAEVSFKTGFSSPAWFSNCFREYFGYPPGEARKMQANLPEVNGNAASAETSGPTTESGQDERKDGEKEKVSLTKRKPPLWAIFLGISAVIAAVLVYPKIFRQDNTENLTSADGRISIAVMPFQNRTNDSTLDFYEGGIQGDLINILSNYSEELSVKQQNHLYNLIQSQGITNYASITPAVASSISKKLDARVNIYGSINKSNETIRIIAHLANTKTQEVFQSYEENGTVANIFPLIDSIKVSVRNYLLVSILKKKLTNDLQHFVSTSSPQALRFYLEGQTAFFNRDWKTAKNMFVETLKRDPNFHGALFFLSVANGNQGQIEEARKYCLEIYEKRDQIESPYDRAWVNSWYASIIEHNPQEEIKYLNQLLEMDDQQPNVHYQIGLAYNQLWQFNKAIPEFERALEIYNKWNIKPMWPANYILLGIAYHKTGQYEKEKKLYQKAQKDFPEDPRLFYWQAVLALSQGHRTEANRLIEKYKSIRKDMAWSDARIIGDLAFIYFEAGIMDESEKYCRQVLELEPENSSSMNLLACILIEDKGTISEGMALIDRALELSPDDWSYLDTKGLGFFKQGKYKEAMEWLEKSDSVKPNYQHYIFIHLEEAKKAIADQK